MAKSRFEYVKQFEQAVSALKNTWLVVRVDGKAFHRFTDLHHFEKPNDPRGLSLMSRAAAAVMAEFRDVTLAFGASDEYSFVFRRSTSIYNRRTDKLLSLVTSLFSSSYVFHWGSYFEGTQLLYPPAFDSRLVLYPTDENLRDYLAWRQADVHVNNLYNTCFWSLVQKKGMSGAEAEAALRGTLSSHKNELLFQQFAINYNEEPALFRKGTILLRKTVLPAGVSVVALHEDLIRDHFWAAHPELLAGSGTAPHLPSTPGLLTFTSQPPLQALTSPGSPGSQPATTVEGN